MMRAGAFLVALSIVAAAPACRKRVPPPPEPSEPSDEARAADLCAKSGGVVANALCCGMADDFPSDCAPGPCSCSPENSHEVKTCRCPPTQCWRPDAGCVARH